jgi:hypothetical protein
LADHGKKGPNDGYPLQSLAPETPDVCGSVNVWTDDSPGRYGAP